MDTVSETVSKVDEGLQEMGIDGVKDSLKDLLNFKQYMENQVPAVMGFCIKVVLSVIVFFVGRKIIQWICDGWSGTTGRSCKSGRRSSFVAF